MGFRAWGLGLRVLGLVSKGSYLRLLGPKTMQHQAFWAILSLRVKV